MKILTKASKEIAKPVKLKEMNVDISMNEEQRQKMEELLKVELQFWNKK